VNHQRWKQVANYGGVAETIWYIGGLLEKVTRSGVTEFRHRIPAGSGSAIYTRRDNGTASTYYVTSDHLGSGDLVLDSAANVLARESFTPFGARRGSNWQGNPSGADYTTFQNTTRRGFTGHEMLDAVSLVHMNGRVYDPYVGRFLSPDPIIQTLALSQALNPFSYVMNNPLSLIDPSGYSWLSKAFRSIGKFFKKFWRPIVAIIAAVVSFGYFAPMASQWLATSVCLMPGTITAGGAAIAGGISGALAGGIVGGWKGAAIGLASGILFSGSHSLWKGVRSTFGRGFGEAATSGAIGGATAEAANGRFRDGFLFAFAASAANSLYRYETNDRYDATWKSGGEPHSKTPASPDWEPANPAWNNIGVANRAPNALPGVWRWVPKYEGNWLFRGLNRIPGFNSFATVHDWFMDALPSNWLSQVANLPSMAPAFGVNYAALLHGPPSVALQVARE